MLPKRDGQNLLSYLQRLGEQKMLLSSFHLLLQICPPIVLTGTQRRPGAPQTCANNISNPLSLAFCASAPDLGGYPVWRYPLV